MHYNPYNMKYSESFAATWHSKRKNNEESRRIMEKETEYRIISKAFTGDNRINVELSHRSYAYQEAETDNDGKVVIKSIYLPHKSTDEDQLNLLIHESGHVIFSRPFINPNINTENGRTIINLIEDLRISNLLFFINYNKAQKHKTFMRNRVENLINNYNTYAKTSRVSYEILNFFSSLFLEQARIEYGITEEIKQCTEDKKVKKALEIIKRNGATLGSFSNVEKTTEEILKLLDNKTTFKHTRAHDKLIEEKFNHDFIRNESDFNMKKHTSGYLQNKDVENLSEFNPNKNKEEAEKLIKQYIEQQGKLTNKIISGANFLKECKDFQKRPLFSIFSPIRSKAIGKATGNELRRIMWENKQKKAHKEGIRLNMPNLIRAKINNKMFLEVNPFFKTQIKQNNKAVFHVLADFSGSMKHTTDGYTRGAYAKAGLLSLGEALKLINVDYCLEGFTCNSLGHVCRHEIKPYGKPLKSNAIEQAGYVGDEFCENNDGASVRFATRDLMNRKENKKVLIVISDGNPSHSETNVAPEENLINAVNEARSKGIKVLGIGIKGCTVSFHKKVFGKNYIDLSENMDKLPIEMINAVRQEVI